MASSVFMLVAAGMLAVGLAAPLPPQLPSKISVTQSGSAFAYTKHGAGYRVSDRYYIKWDLDQNCLGMAKFDSQGINEWREFVSCGGRYSEYSSDSDTCWSQDVSAEQANLPIDRLQALYSGFSRHISDRLRDPIWNQKFHRVFRNDEKNASIYVSLEDNSVQYLKLQDYLPGGEDYIVHFPNGLRQENSSGNFTFEKAPCIHRQANTSTSEESVEGIFQNKRRSPISLAENNSDAERLFEELDKSP